MNPSAGAVITGAGGATVSTVNVTVSAGETLPAASVCVAEIVCGPSANGVVGVTDHVPSAATTAVPSTVPAASVTVTVAPGSPVPVIVGVASLTVDPSAGAVITGAGVASVSTVNVT